MNQVFIRPNGTIIAVHTAECLITVDQYSNFGDVVKVWVPEAETPRPINDDGSPNKLPDDWAERYPHSEDRRR